MASIQIIPKEVIDAGKYLMGAIVGGSIALWFSRKRDKGSLSDVAKEKYLDIIAEQRAKLTAADARGLGYYFGQSVPVISNAAHAVMRHLSRRKKKRLRTLLEEYGARSKTEFNEVAVAAAAVKVDLPSSSARAGRTVEQQLADYLDGFEKCAR